MRRGRQQRRVRSEAASSALPVVRLTTSAMGCGGREAGHDVRRRLVVERCESEDANGAGQRGWRLTRAAGRGSMASTIHVRPVTGKGVAADEHVMTCAWIDVFEGFASSQVNS